MIWVWIKSCVTRLFCSSPIGFEFGGFVPSQAIFTNRSTLKIILRMNFKIIIFLYLRSRDGNFGLELDFEPFNASFPRPSQSTSIGNGVQFLNRHLSSKLFIDRDSMEPLLNFLQMHNYKGTVFFFFGSCSTIIVFFLDLKWSLNLFWTKTKKRENSHQSRAISFMFWMLIVILNTFFKKK